MSLREDAARTHPDFPWLDASDRALERSRDAMMAGDFTRLWANN